MGSAAPHCLSGDSVWARLASWLTTTVYPHRKRMIVTTPESLTGELASAAEHVAEQARAAQESLRTLDHRVVKYVKQRPATCILAALAGGFVVGRMSRAPRSHPAPSAAQSILKEGFAMLLRAAAIALINDRISAMMRTRA